MRTSPIPAIQQLLPGNGWRVGCPVPLCSKELLSPGTCGDSYHHDFEF
jgi:hypothetical protein